MIHEKVIIPEKTDQSEEAYMITYFWEESKELYPGQRRPVILICPGGAYRMTSFYGGGLSHRRFKIQHGSRQISGGIVPACKDSEHPEGKK